MARTTVPAADAIIDKAYPVLDHGFVRLVDYMGGDDRIVQAARVSYGEGTKSVNEDRGLIDHLIRNQHTSPLEQVVLTFHCKMPIFVARQWVRHRTARLNEMSGRYSIMPAEHYVPAVADINAQSTGNKQGRVEGEQLLQAEAIKELLRSSGAHSFSTYDELMDAGLSREVARINLPLSTYTEWYWQIDLNNLFHFMRLRMDAHAQKEIRVYAEAIYEIAKAVAPMAVASFDDHIRGSISFSAREWAYIKEVITGNGEAATRAFTQLSVKEQERLIEKTSTGRQT
jgi:thymidylate synthase (FAD)